MKTSLLALSLLLPSSAGTAAQPDARPEPAREAAAEVSPERSGPAALPLRARLSDDAIRQAVRETLAQAPERPAGAGEGEVLSGDGYRAFSRTFGEARKPSCLAPDALKHQPPQLTIKRWSVGIGGLLALPFWGAAIVRGKCN